MKLNILFNKTRYHRIISADCREEIHWINHCVLDSVLLLIKAAVRALQSTLQRTVSSGSKTTPACVRLSANLLAFPAADLHRSDDFELIDDVMTSQRAPACLAIHVDMICVCARVGKSPAVAMDSCLTSRQLIITQYHGVQRN